MKRTLVLVLLAIGLASDGTGTAQKKAWWPQFRGPGSSGLGEGNPPIQFGPDQNVKWKTQVGPGLSSPIVWDGRIFLTEFDSTKRQLSALCLDSRSGKLLWRRLLT